MRIGEQDLSVGTSGCHQQHTSTWWPSNEGLGLGDTAQFAHSIQIGIQAGMARGLKQQQQQQQGWKEETSINTYTHKCTHALSLNLSPSPTPPKTPSNEHEHLPKGNAIRSWK